MKYIINLFAVFFLNTGCTNSQDQCSCEATLKRKHQTYNVYSLKDIDSKVLYTIENDSINENYFVIELHAINAQWGFVTAYSPTKDYKNKGWLKTEDLEVYPSDHSEPLFLFERPDKNSLRTEVKGYNYNPLTVLDCTNEWLKVKYTISQNTFIGWLPKTNQCANPYTTCN